MTKLSISIGPFTIGPFNLKKEKKKFRTAFIKIYLNSTILNRRVYLPAHGGGRMPIVHETISEQRHLTMECINGIIKNDSIFKKDEEIYTNLRKLQEIFKSFLTTTEKLIKKLGNEALDSVEYLPVEAQKACKLEMKNFRKSCLPLFRNLVDKLENDDLLRMEVESVLYDMESASIFEI